MTVGALNNAIIGSHTEAEWLQLVEDWGWRCFYCAKPVCANSLDKEAELSKDHLVPTSRGGVDFIWNIVPACIACNRLKTDMTVDEFRAARPVLCENISEKSTSDLSLTTRPLSGFAVQAVDYLAKRMDMNAPFSAADRRKILKQQADAIHRRRLTEAGQLALDFSEIAPLVFKGIEIAERKSPHADRITELRQQVAEIEQRRKA
jgi:HNH endonuclease